MASRDSAFLWETEALRSFPRPSRGPDSQSSPAADDWLTLREASEVTGVPVDTIRKWARHENVPSYLESSPGGRLRMVSLEGINRWADELGRDIENDPDTTDQVDLTRDEFQGRERSDAGAAEDVGSGVPEGTMLVPLDAWNKMLNQLGNLHEAGQQLAEARERAAKAETEATFLRERLSDMRAQLEEARAAEDEAPETETERPSSGKADQQRDAELSVSRFTKAKAKQLYRRWRTR